MSGHVFKTATLSLFALVAAVACAGTREVDTRLRIGSHLYLRRDMSEAEIFAAIGKMREIGMNVVRVYPYWADVETARGEYDFTRVDACYRACEKFGLGVLHTFKLNAPPAWMNLTRSFNLDDFGDLDSPAFRDALKKFVVRSVERYGKSPALVAWCPWNEPRFPMPQRFAPYALDAYRDYLKRRYGGRLDDLNAIYFHRFPTWEKVFEPSAPIQPQTLMDYPERMDFLAFKGDMIARLLKDVETWIDEVDGRHPHHVNPWEFVGNDLGRTWTDAEASDFVGGSIYPVWLGRYFRTTLHGYVCDFLRSATKRADRLYWITETQGGMALFTGGARGCPDASELKLWAYDMLGSGAKGIVYWTLLPTIRGEWALLNLEGGDSERSDAVKRVCSVVRENKELFDNARPIRPEVFILDSESALQLATIRGGGDKWSYRGSAAPAMARFCTWCMMQNAGLEAGFIDESRVQRGGLEGVKTLVVPDCAALEDRTLDAIEAWVSAGGTLVADGQFARYDGHGIIRADRKRKVDDLMGVRLLDWLCTTGGTDCVVTESGATKTPNNAYKAVFEGTSANMTDHPHGKGRAVWIGTRFFGFWLTPDDGTDPHLASRFDWRDVGGLFMPAPTSGIILENASLSLRIRRLVGAGGKTALITLLNFRNRASAGIRSKEAIRLRSLDTGRTFDIPAGGKVEIPMDPHTAEFFRVEYVGARQRD